MIQDSTTAHMALDAGWLEGLGAAPTTSVTRPNRVASMDAGVTSSAPLTFAYKIPLPRVWRESWRVCSGRGALAGPQGTS